MTKNGAGAQQRRVLAALKALQQANGGRPVRLADLVDDLSTSMPRTHAYARVRRLTQLGKVACWADGRLGLPNDPRMIRLTYEGTTDVD